MTTTPAVTPTSAIDQAVEVDHAACVARYASLPGASLERSGGQQELHTGLPSGFFNNAILLRWSETDAVGALATVVERARARGAPWRLYVTAATTPPDLVGALPAAGLVPGIPGRSMVLTDPAAVSVPAVEGLSIEPVASDTDLERWLAVRRITNGWTDAPVDAWRQAGRRIGYAADPPIRAWFGSLGGEPVANVALHLAEGQPDGTRDAGIYNVETIPSARRRGIATAMTAHAVAAAVAAGATRVVLSATDMAASAYARLGFRSGGSFTYWYDPGLGA